MEAGREEDETILANEHDNAFLKRFRDIDEMDQNEGQKLDLLIKEGKKYIEVRDQDSSFFYPPKYEYVSTNSVKQATVENTFTIDLNMAMYMAKKMNRTKHYIVKERVDNEYPLAGRWDKTLKLSCFPRIYIMGNHMDFIIVIVEEIGDKIQHPGTLMKNRCSYQTTEMESAFVDYWFRTGLDKGELNQCINFHTFHDGESMSIKYTNILTKKKPKHFLKKQACQNMILTEVMRSYIKMREKGKKKEESVPDVEELLKSDSEEDFDIDAILDYSDTDEEVEDRNRMETSSVTMPAAAPAEVDKAVTEVTRGLEELLEYNEVQVMEVVANGDRTDEEHRVLTGQGEGVVDQAPIHRMETDSGPTAAAAPADVDKAVTELLAIVGDGDRMNEEQRSQTGQGEEAIEGPTGSCEALRFNCLSSQSYEKMIEAGDTFPSRVYKKRKSNKSRNRNAKDRKLKRLREQH